MDKVQLCKDQDVGKDPFLTKCRSVISYLNDLIIGRKTKGGQKLSGISNLKQLPPRFIPIDPSRRFMWQVDMNSLSSKVSDSSDSRPIIVTVHFIHCTFFLNGHPTMYPLKVFLSQDSGSFQSSVRIHRWVLVVFCVSASTDVFRSFYSAPVCVHLE